MLFHLQDVNVASGAAEDNAGGVVVHLTGFQGRVDCDYSLVVLVYGGLRA
jgi:hypothetical protein